MLNLLRGEIYKIKKDNLSKIMILVYIIGGIFYFFQSRTIYDYDMSELVKDGTIDIFSSMLGNVSQYGNELKSTIVILGMIAVFGFLSALFVIPIFTSISVSDEYSTRSLQQFSGKGIRRFKLVLSKFFGVCGFVILMNICMLAIGMFTTIVFLGMGNLPEFAMILVSFEIKVLLMNVVFITVSIFFAFIVKNCGIAMPLSFISIICLIGELAGKSLETGVMKPTITYLLISLVFIGGTIIKFNKSDL